MPDLQLERYLGAMEGMACGDALGAGPATADPGSPIPLDRMTGGGPYNLRPGDWTEVTSTALCLAEVLTETGRFDSRDMMDRMLRWQNEGHLSSTGASFEIGHGVMRSLAWYACTGAAQPAPAGRGGTDRGSLVRVPPVALAFAHSPKKAISVAASSSRATHCSRVDVDACRYFTALLVGALWGEPRERLLDPSVPYTPVPGLWESRPLAPEILAIANGSFNDGESPPLESAGNPSHALQAALRAFLHAADFRSGALLAVGQTLDPTGVGALYGALAGAHFGVESIPAKWRYPLAQRPTIRRLARNLFKRAQTSSGASSPSGKKE